MMRNIKKHDIALMTVIAFLSFYIFMSSPHLYGNANVNNNTYDDANTISVLEYNNLDNLSEREKCWIDDINYLKYEFPKLYENMYVYITENEYFFKLNTLVDNIETMSDYQVVLELSEIINSIKGSHTALIFDFPHAYPIKFHKFGDDYYVIGVASSHTKNVDLLFQRVVQIQGVDIKYILSELKKYLDLRNEYMNDAVAVKYLSSPELLEFIGIPMSNNYNTVFTFINSTGESFTRAIDPVDSSDSLSFYTGISEDSVRMNHNNENYWFHYYEDTHLLYVNYNICIEMSEYSFQDFTNDVFNVFDNERVDKLFFDIRSNPGGHGIHNPFILEIKKRESFFSEKGNFFIAISHGTFSSALVAFDELKKNSNAVVIGTPTGHRFYGDIGEGKYCELPNSKLTLMYQAGGYTSFPYDKPPYEYAPSWDTAFYPDVYIYEDIESYMRGEDKLMDWVVNYQK